MAKTRNNRLRTSATRKRGYKRGNKMSPTKALTIPQRRAVKAIVKGQGETKLAAWYSGGSNPLGIGDRVGWANEPQNAQIVSNTTDIKRLVPLVLTGTGDNQRIGERINPLSLVVHGNISLNTTNVLTPINNQDFYAVIYVLQHVSLKTYSSLQSVPSGSPVVNVGGNDFTQLLKTGEGDTCAFTGVAYQADLPVSEQYYKLCAKRIVPLRYAGAQVSPPGSAIPGGAGVVSVANSHNFTARYTFNLTKHIPKIMRFPETTITTPSAGDPTNSSLFMCVGYYRMDELTAGEAAYLSNSYVSLMKYKDM